MKVRHISPARFGLFMFTAIWFLVVLPLSAIAAPYAAMVMDARTGEVLHSRNADTRLHPASLTKMMTLYVAFEAVESGEINLDDMVKISRNAAAEPPSKLGLRSGSKIKLRYLIRASAVKSANDAATAIGEAISGSEAAFARRMNRTAKALGMTRTTFKNAHGLTERGHMSTARDMTLLGRRMLYDYPQYYNLFSRTSVNAGIKTVNNTNRRLLGAYRGADGIKTGYTRAAGFNLVASAERGNERIIATVFGGKSTSSRNARVAELLDMGFNRAPSHATLRKPAPPNYAAVKMWGPVRSSLRPRARPDATTAPMLLASANSTPAVSPSDIQSALMAAQAAVSVGDAVLRPTARPGTAGRSADVIQASLRNAPTVVTRVSSSGNQHWGVNIGRFNTRYKAEKVLLQTALTEMSTLDGSLRKVVRRPQGFEANFMGMSREKADLACRRLAARNMKCELIGPS